MPDVNFNNWPIEKMVLETFSDQTDWGTRRELVKFLVEKDSRFSSNDLRLLTNRSGGESGETIAHLLAQAGYVFSLDELMRLDNPPDLHGWTVAHAMILHGFVPTVDQILALGDPSDILYNSLSILMTRRGHFFTFEEIMRLKNPSDWYGTTLAHLSIFNNYFSVEQLRQLGNPADKDGDTIAHMMAKAGQVFNAKELARLGNPGDNYGNSVATIMALKGYKFSPMEKVEFRIPTKLQTEKYIFEIKKLSSWGGLNGAEWDCDLYVDGRLSANCLAVSDVPIRYTVYNQTTYSIFEKEALSFCQKIPKSELSPYFRDWDLSCVDGAKVVFLSDLMNEKVPGRKAVAD